MSLSCADRRFFFGRSPFDERVLFFLDLEDFFFAITYSDFKVVEPENFTYFVVAFSNLVQKCDRTNEKCADCVISEEIIS